MFYDYDPYAKAKCNIAVLHIFVIFVTSSANVKNGWDLMNTLSRGVISSADTNT